MRTHLAAAIVAFPVLFGATLAQAPHLSAKLPAAPDAPRMPFFFLENQGQWATDACFIARHPDYVARFHHDGLVVQRELHTPAPQGVMVKLAFVGARRAPQAEDMLPGRVHTFVGRGQAARRELIACGTLRYRDLWPGVDLVVHDHGGELEYDLVLAPGADLDAVALRCEGAESVSIAGGVLVMRTPLGEIRQPAPRTWEVLADGSRRDVACHFTLRLDGSYGFTAPGRVPHRPLVVDPVILWASYFGATGTDVPQGLTCDASGNVFVTGYTSSLFTFPTTPGSYSPTFRGGLYDAFVAKLDPSLSGVAQLRWCTFFGGSDNDYGQRVTLGPSGEVVVCGYTVSNDLPVTAGALDSTYAASNDGFVCVLSGTGASLLYCTYVGGTGDDVIYLLAVEPDGTIDVAGYTSSSGMPVSTGANQATNGGGYDIWVGRLDRTQTGSAQLVFGTYQGSGGGDYPYGLAISSVIAGRLTLTGYTTSIGGTFNGFQSGALAGEDVFVVQFDPALTGAAQRRFLHFLGGGADYGYGVAIEANGDVVVTGQCGSLFPVTPGSYRTSGSSADGFLTKLTANGASIRYSTFLGATSSIVPGNVFVAADGTVTLAGYTSSNLTLTTGAIDTVRGGTYEGFVMRLNAPLTQLSYATYIGGNGDEVVPLAGACLAGDVMTLCCYTNSAGLTVQNPYQGGYQGGVHDGYLFRFDLVTTPIGGAGSISFTPTTQPVGSAPRGVALADVDGDNDRDIVTANAGSHDVTLRRNNGSGSFSAPPETLALGAGNQAPQALAGGDFDGDSSADDLVVACADTSTLAFVLDAAGMAPTVITHAMVGLRPVHVAGGSLDATVGTDVVIGCEGSTIVGGAGIEVSRNGAAPVALTIPMGRAMRVVRVALGDLDGDGDTDIAAVAQGTADEIHLWANDGAGAFTFAGFLTLVTSGTAGGLCVGDLEFDNDVDLVVAQPVLFPTPTQTLRVYRYTGSGSLDASDYTVAPAIASPGFYALALACADLDNDRVAGFGGGADLIVVNAGSGTVDGHNAFDGATQTFAVIGTVPSGAGPVDVALGDVDGDTTTDVVIVNQSANTVTISRVDGAIARRFGTGCAGTGGLVPRIGAIGLPRLGTTFGVQLTLARANAPALIFFAFAAQSTPLGGGCTLYLQAPLINLFRLTDGSGQHTFGQFIPNLPSLLGLDAFYQWAVFDPAGAFASTLAISDALRIQIGA